MTGEITLSGRVLPVGGIKEKVLAARRHGITEVILPRQNEKNINEDLTEELRRELTIHYVVHIEEVLALALLPSSDRRRHTGLPMTADQRSSMTSQSEPAVRDSTRTPDSSDRVRSASARRPSSCRRSRRGGSCPARPRSANVCGSMSSSSSWRRGLGRRASGPTAG